MKMSEVDGEKYYGAEVICALAYCDCRVVVSGD